MKKFLLGLLVPALATMFVSIDTYDSDMELVNSRLDNLENETIEVVSECNLIALLEDVEKAEEQGYSFDIIDGVLYEYKDGELTGDTFTNEDLIEDYCK